MSAAVLAAAAGSRVMQFA
jgi:hypothetical protein